MRLVVGLGVLLFASPNLAAAQEQVSFEEQVRAALLNNPEIILEVFEILEQKEQAATDQRDQQSIAQHSKELFGSLPVDQPVLVEFVDYQCGYCRRFHQEVAAFKKQHPDLVVVQKHLPILGDASKSSARIALAVLQVEGASAYAQFHTDLMTGTINPRDNMYPHLVQKGYNAEAILSEADGSEVAKALTDSAALAKLLSIEGTPGIVTRSQIVRGFVDRERLSEVVFQRQRP